jgi:hypothetical protein
LKDRFSEVGIAEGFTPDEQTLSLIEHFLRHPSNLRLAKHVVYTQGKTPAETSAEITALLV